MPLLLNRAIAKTVSQRQNQGSTDDVTGGKLRDCPHRVNSPHSRVARMSKSPYCAMLIRRTTTAYVITGTFR
jgi:hypothetical protein